jgi:hypothetical protein
MDTYWKWYDPWRTKFIHMTLCIHYEMNNLITFHKAIHLIGDEFGCIVTKKGGPTPLRRTDNLNRLSSYDHFVLLKLLSFSATSSRVSFDHTPSTCRHGLRSHRKWQSWLPKQGLQTLFTDARWSHNFSGYKASIRLRTPYTLDPH